MTAPSLTLLRQFALIVLALGIVPLASSNEPGPAQPRSAITRDAAQARVIVKYKTDSGLMRALSATSAGGARPQHAEALSRRLALRLADGRVLGSRTQGLRGAGLTSSQLAAKLAAQTDVEWAVPDERRYISALTNDPLLPGGQVPPVTPTVGQWYLRAPDNTAVSAINAVDAWDTTTGSASITIAVLDTGVRFDHPDLAAKLHPGYDFVQADAAGNDATSGRDDDASDPGDWTTVNQCQPGEPAKASSWHGTQVAGLIGAATNNGVGMAGVGRNVMVLPVRVLGRCGGSDSDIIAAARWAAGLSSDVGSGLPVVNPHPAKVINMSFGSTGTCPPQYRDLLTELNAAGVSVVVAAGNENGLAVNVPANCAGAIAVAGLRHVGTKVGYSSIGPQVALAAPAGNCVNLVGPCLYPLLTTVNSSTTTPQAGINTYTDSGDPTLGTSFSAPLVAGTIGLMLSANPALTPAQVTAVLKSTARVFPTSGGESAATICHAPNGVDQLECYCTTDTCGAGMLDTARAVVMALTPPAIVATPVTSAGVGGGGGGGALDWVWLAGLGAAALAAWLWRLRAAAGSGSV